MTIINTPVIAQALIGNHAGGVVRTPVIARSISQNHAEGVVGH